MICVSQLQVYFLYKIDLTFFAHIILHGYNYGVLSKLGCFRFETAVQCLLKNIFLLSCAANL